MLTAAILYCLALWISGSAAYALLRARSAARSEFSVTQKALFAAQFLGATCAGVAVYMAAPMLLAPAAMLPTRCVAAVLLFSAVIHGVLGLRGSATKPRETSAAIILCIGGAALWFAVFLRSCPGEALAIEFPLHGTWRVVTGGRSSLTNYHHNQPPQQNFAIDLALHDQPERSLGQAVYSPCDCTVDRVSTDTASAEGNLLVLRTAEGIDIWLAHLQDGSTSVQAGDHVTPGAEIARVGATGSAESPHLHIHAEKNKAAVPMRFGRAKRYLVRGDVFAYKPNVK
jgi:hypothetical protein